MMKLLVAAALVALSSCLPADNLVFSFSQYNPAGNQPFEAYWSDFKNTHSKLPFIFIMIVNIVYVLTSRQAGITTITHESLWW